MVALGAFFACGHSNTYNSNVIATPNSICSAKFPRSYLASALALDDPQHCLYFRPELQGQGALRPGGLPAKLRAAV